MSDSTEKNAIADEKFKSSTEHTKKAIEAATTATRQVLDTGKKHAQEAIGVGKEHLSAAAKDLGDAAAAKYDDLRTQATQVAQEYRGKAQSALSDASVAAHNFQGETESYIRENPLKAVGIALGAGFVLGLILRR